MPLLDSLLLGLNSLQPAFLDAVLAPGLPRHGGAWPGPAKAQLLCLPVAFLCLNPVSLLAMRELAPGLFVSSPALGPFLWGYVSSLLGRLRYLWLGLRYLRLGRLRYLWLGLRYLRLGRLLDLRLPGRFGLFLLRRRGDVYGVLESMAFAVFRGRRRLLLGSVRLRPRCKTGACAEWQAGRLQSRMGPPVASPVPPAS